MSKYYIGIDPGKSGALAMFNEDRTEFELVPYAEDNYMTVLESVQFHDCKCCLEEVHSMPKQGVASTFTFGMNFGIIKGMLKALRIPFQEVKPQTWKKEFNLNADKAKSVEVAKHLFPMCDLKRTPKCKKEDDGIAEALLMAEYARRKL